MEEFVELLDVELPEEELLEELVLLLPDDALPCEEFEALLSWSMMSCPPATMKSW